MEEQPRPRAVFLAPEAPYPPAGGGALRSASLLQYLAGRYRLRTGDYRIQFQVVGDLVTVEKIGHRDGFYGE